MFTENLFHTELASQQERDIQTCSSHHQVRQPNIKDTPEGQIFSSQDGAVAGMEAKDFTSYLIYINIYMKVRTPHGLQSIGNNGGRRDI